MHIREQGWDDYVRSNDEVNINISLPFQHLSTINNLFHITCEQSNKFSLP